MRVTRRRVAIITVATIAVIAAGQLIIASGAYPCVTLRYGRSSKRYFSNCNCKGIHVRERDLGGSNLNRAYLAFCLIDHVDLSHSVMTNANLFFGSVEGSNMYHADLRRSVLSYAAFTRCDMRYSDLRGADLKYAFITESDLSHADLSGADLVGCHFDKATVWPDQYDPIAHGAEIY
jgi:uncharacterized protein YjbI with pentapeptide repeats